MKMFVNTSGVPFETAKPRLFGRIVGGTTTTIQNHPFQLWPFHCFSVWRYFEIFENKRPPVFVMKFYASKHIKNALAVCSSGGIIDWTEENWWFCSVISCFINCIAVSFHVGLLLQFFYQQSNK